MNQFVHYLQEVKEAALTKSDSLRIAIGNTSGDMDSIVGAMGLAYYLTLKTDKLWTPVLNCHQQDLKLKTEIHYHLIDECKLKLDDLFFYDQLLTSGREVEEIALIDHNLLDSKQADELGPDAHSKVTYVYDHHVDCKFYPWSQVKDYQVRLIGSACSLLVLQIMDNLHLFDMKLFDK